jgi:peroxiredoxin
LAEHARRYDELAGLGFGLAAISVDVVERSRALADQLQLPFPLLCDPGRDVVRAYGVFNEQEKAGIAYPSTFAIDRDRVVRFRSLDRTTSRVDLDGLFEFLRGGTAPSEPPRATISPGLRGFGRALKNMLRYGVKSPKPK